MSSKKGDEAMKKVWNTSDVAEMLLPFLSAGDILNVLQLGLLNIKILQMPSIWKKLINRRLQPVQANEPWNGWTIVVRIEPLINILINILKMMKDHKPSLIDLLNLICERFPSSKTTEVVTLTCPANQTKLVSALGFRLLEQVEGALGSTEQKIDQFRIDENRFSGELRKTLPALSARMARQQQEVQLVEMSSIDVSAHGEETLKHFAILVENCQAIRIGTVELRRPLENCSKLRRVLCSSHLSLVCFSPTRDGLHGLYRWEPEWNGVPAKRDDLRAIWDITKGSWEVRTWIDETRYGHTHFHKNEGDEEWRKVEQLLDMSEEEMRAWDKHCCSKWLVHERDYHERLYYGMDDSDDQVGDSGEEEGDDYDYDYEYGYDWYLEYPRDLEYLP